MRNNDFLKIMILRESFSRKDEKRNTVVKKTNFYAIQKIELIADARVIGDDPKNHVVKINDGTIFFTRNFCLPQAIKQDSFRY